MSYAAEEGDPSTTLAVLERQRPGADHPSQARPDPQTPSARSNGEEQTALAIGQEAMATLRAQMATQR